MTFSSTLAVKGDEKDRKEMARTEESSKRLGLVWFNCLQCERVVLIVILSIVEHLF